MTKPRWQWLQRERQAFCEILAQTGDPVAAAAAVQKSLAEAYRQREMVPGFEAEWQKALAIAWDHVETRVLANLLARDVPVVTAAGDKDAKPVRLLDSRMALAVLQRRDAPRAVRGPKVDNRRVQALRDEIRMLAAR